MRTDCGNENLLEATESVPHRAAALDCAGILDKRDCDPSHFTAGFNGESVSGAEQFDGPGRYATLGSLALRIVHDLRNPLSAIHSAAEMLFCSDLSRSQVERLVRNMYQASLRSQDLLQSFVDLCRWKSGRRERCHLRNLVSASVSRISSAAQSRSVLIAQDIPDDVVLLPDRARIECVLDNLLANALEAMPGGGAIHVSAVPLETSILIDIRDTGPGIAPEIRDRLFQPFVTAGKAKGLGLGLAASRQAVIENGGQIWLQSAPGWGACFAVTLPLQSEMIACAEGE